ncbi:MAG: hypothetical protein KBA75_01880 [Alphaproteobacteria bacterium]|nr:hypothetical protein [Alphaproteobacteria bacterium]
MAIDPTPYSTIRDFADAASFRLHALTAPWAEHHHHPIATFRITKPLYELAKTDADITARGEISPGMQTGVAARAYWSGPSGAQIHPNYVCMAVGLLAKQSVAEYTTKEIRQIASVYTTQTERFSKMLDYADPERLDIIQHEIDHCLRGAPKLTGETLTAMSRRLESTADAFAAISRIQRDEPDMANKLMIKAEWRRSNLLISNFPDTWHYSTGVLQMIAEDLRQNPKLGETFKNLTPSERDAKAYDYALRAHLKDYPHLFDKTMSTKEKLSRSNTVDQELFVARNFVSGALLMPGYDHLPISAPPETALHIARLEYTATNYLNPLAGTQFKERMADLRAAFPTEMRAADKAFAEELKRFPPPQLPNESTSSLSTHSVARSASANQRHRLAPN